MRCWGRDTGRSPTLTPTVSTYLYDTPPFSPTTSHIDGQTRETQFLSIVRTGTFLHTGNLLQWHTNSDTCRIHCMVNGYFWMWEMYVVMKFRSIFHAAPTIYWHLILFVIMRKSFPISIFLTSRRCKFSHLHLHSRAWWPSLQNHIITINIVHPTCITNHAATERSWTNKPWTSVRACKSGRPSTERWRRW
jgi:hypothetical protein